MLNEREVVAKVRRLQLRELRVWVREGWVRPAQGETEPIFDALDIARIRLLCDLRKDMSMPNDAVGVILSLVDQVHGLRTELRGLSAALERQPADVRNAIVAAWRSTADEDGQE